MAELSRLGRGFVVCEQLMKVHDVCRHVNVTVNVHAVHTVHM